MMPGIKRAASFWLRNLEWRLEEESADDRLHGWAVLRTGSSDDVRPFDFFVDF
jgi:hypothetical protein